MVNNKFLGCPKLFFIFFSLLPITAQAMERAPKKSQSIPVATLVQPLEPCRLFATPKDKIIASMAADIQLAQADDYIGLESPFLSNKLILQELMQASERGVRVSIFTNQKSMAQLRPALEKTKINMVEINNLHAKRIIINAKELKIVWLGSMNMSEHSSQNHEIMMRCTDLKSFKESFGDQQRLGQPFYNRTTPAVNFSARRIINSSTPEAQEAKNRVIEEFGSCSHPHDYLYFVSYTLDDKKLFDAIMKAKRSTHKPITVLLDGDCWKNINMRYEALMPLVKEGVNVYIYNKNNDIKTTFGHNKVMHIKAILRKCNQQCLALVSTANFTPRGKEEINHDLWEPCSLEFSRNLKEIIDPIISESVLLTHRDFPVVQTPQQMTARLLDLMRFDQDIYPNKEEIIYLIKKCANVNAMKIDAAPPLIRAISADQPDLAELLIQAGANVNYADEFGMTPLRQAAGKGFSGIVQVLLDAGAQIDYTDKYGNSPLFITIGGNHIHTAKLLIAHGADVNLGGDYREYGYRKEFKGTIPPLTYAVIQQRPELVETLLKAGARVNATDREGLTALWHACKNRNSQLINILASAGANLNIFNPKTSTTPLISAVQGNDYELVKALLNAGADLNARDNLGKIASQYAKDKQIIDLLNAVKELRENPMMVGE